LEDYAEKQNIPREEVVFSQNSVEESKSESVESVKLPTIIIPSPSASDNHSPLTEMSEEDLLKMEGPKLKDDPRVCKYFTMLKLGVIRKQIEMELEMNGISLDLLNLNPNLPAKVLDEMEYLFPVTPTL